MKILKLSSALFPLSQPDLMEISRAKLPLLAIHGTLLVLYSRAVKSRAKAGVLCESRSKAQVSSFSAGLGGSGRRNSPKQNREKKNIYKEEAGCGHRKAYFFKTTSGSYVTLNFSAAAL